MAIGVRTTTTNIFVNIGQEKLAVFWINGARREDSVGMLALCIEEDHNKPMEIRYLGILSISWG